MRRWPFLLALLVAAPIAVASTQTQEFTVGHLKWGSPSLAAVNASFPTKVARF
jgi:hypothetical protein